MSFKKIYKYNESTSRRVFTQNNFKSGIRYGMNGIRTNETLQYMDNFLLKDGSLVSRPGVRHAYSLIKDECRACIVFNNKLFMQLGDNLYYWEYPDTDSPVFINSISKSTCMMFSYSGVLYIMSPEGYYRYTTKLEKIDPYVPVVAIDRSMDGSTTTVYESFNMIGDGFEVWFNYTGDGAYKLPVKDLKSDFSVTLSGSDITHLCTFDPDKGIVTVKGFTEEDEGINNLRVKAFRMDDEVLISKSKIFGCKYSAVFGGTDGLGTRVFLAGNDLYPNFCFRSGLLDPSYFPDTEYEIISHEGDKITGLIKQYNELIVFCEKSIHALSYIFNQGDIIFSRRTVNPSLGCDMPYSIQLIDNNAVFCSSKKGVFMLGSTVSENENNVLPISANINSGESGLIIQTKKASKKAFSLDHDGKYYLFVGKNAYVWDYSEMPYLTEYGTLRAERKLCWYILNGITVNFPVAYYEYIFFFSDKGQIDIYGDSNNDYGQTLHRTLTTSPSGLGLPRIEKKLENITLSYRCKEIVRINIYFYCDGKEGGNYSFSTDLMHDDSLGGSFHRTVFPVSLPTAYAFNVKIDVYGGSFELDCIDYEYTV